MSNYYELKKKLNAFSEDIDELIWKKKELKKKLKRKTIRRRVVKKNLKNNLKAREIINKVVDITHHNLKERIDSLVTLAVKSVFDRNFTFELFMQKKYNRIICTPIIKEDGNEYFPKDEMGVGIIDIISLALRVVLWSIEDPRSRNIFVLDEPMKFVGKGVILKRVGKILSELSSRLAFQLLIVTHERELSEISDRAYHVEYANKMSNLTIID